MPYDPRLMQRGGIPPAFDPTPGPPAAPANRWWEQGQAPQQGAQFAPPPPPQRPKQWYEGLPAMKDPYGKDKDGKPQPTLLDMLMSSGGKGPGMDRPSLGPIPSMGMANMPLSMWSQLTGMFGGTPGGWGGGGGTPG